MKIEIDVSERSLDEQVEAAFTQYRDEYGHAHLACFKAALRDFAAGKFARAPMPEIVKPKWADTVEVRGQARFYVVARAESSDGPEMVGPTKRNRTDAITAWNELFGGAS